MIDNHANVRYALKNIKGLFKNDKFQLFLLFLIAIIAFYLRLIGLNKVGGFWYDEAASYFSAIQSFPFGIVHHSLTADLHPPLYFLLLHLWMKLFGNTDLAIRFFSLTLGVLTVPVMYLAGKSLNSKRTGILAAIFTAINSLLIYYSQEVRVYALVVLLTALSILFLIKVDKAPNKKNYAGLVISNTAMIYAASLSFIFIFFQALSYLIYIFFKDRNRVKSFVTSQIIILIISLPFILTLVHFQSALTKSFVNPFDWAVFTALCPIYAIQDWFSPFLMNIFNYPHGFYENQLSHGLTSFFLISILFPVLVYITGIVRGLSKNITIPLFSSAILYFLFDVFAASTGKIALVTRYTIQSVPVMILLASYGWTRFNLNSIVKVILGFFIVLNLVFLGFSPNAAQKIPRHETIKSVAIDLYKLNLNDKDVVSMPYGSKFLGKYYHKKVNLLEFDVVDTFQGNKKGTLEHVFDPELIKTLTRDNAYSELQAYISSPRPSKALTDYVNSHLQKIERGRFFVLIISRGIAGFSNDDLRKITKSNLYRKQSMMFMLSSKSQNDIIEIASKKLIPVNLINDGIWEIYVFKKD